jgi:hypothetical protein
MGASPDRAALALLALTAASFAWRVSARASLGLGMPVNDIYAYAYPTAVYAWQAIRQGTGLLWNPYQDCGQPFFAATHPALLYPFTTLFFVLDREPALLTSIFLHLAIAGAGTFLLCRTLGVHVPAALCAALTFQLAGSTPFLAMNIPTILGSYAWLPVAVWQTERLVQRPTARRSILVGVVLTVQLLAGYPQIAFFTYQVIALRIAWSLLTRETPRPVAFLAWVGLAMMLPLLLGAVQMLPSFEVMRESVRSVPLVPGQIGPGFSWRSLAANFSNYATFPGTFLVIVMTLVALLARPSRLGRHVTFYAAVACVYFLLSLGPGTPLFDLYSRLPLGTAFRFSQRLLWVTSFALAVLAGLGVETVLVSTRSARFRFLLASAIVAAGLFSLLIPTGHWSDALLALLAAGALFVQPRPAARVGAATVLLVGAIAANCTVFGVPLLDGLRKGDVYGASAPAFALVRARITPQDRVHLIGRYGLQSDFALVQKAAGLYGVPAIFDYEPLASRSYAEFFTFLRTGRTMQGLSDWFWVFDKLMPTTLQQPLFNLTAARYILIDRALDRTPQVLGPSARLLAEVGYIRIYENQEALERARYVPRIMVLPESEILPRLAAPDADLRRRAFVDTPPQSGFLGATDQAAGAAEIVADGAEHLTIRVRAPAPGFLFLADQYSPGWTARVNGRETEILRANHTFRVVEVPTGESDVVFDYRPVSFYRGRLVSLVTVVALVGLWARANRRR